jgi:hypothetical protein
MAKPDTDAKTNRGFNARKDASSKPARATAPGRNPSTKTSALRSSRRRISAPSGFLISTASIRVPAACARKAAPSPASRGGPGGAIQRPISPPEISTLMISAPSSPSR